MRGTGLYNTICAIGHQHQNESLVPLMARSLSSFGVGPAGGPVLSPSCFPFLPSLSLQGSLRLSLSSYTQDTWLAPPSPPCPEDRRQHSYPRQPLRKAHARRRGSPIKNEDLPAPSRFVTSFVDLEEAAPLFL